MKYSLDLSIWSANAPVMDETGKIVARVRRGINGDDWSVIREDGLYWEHGWTAFHTSRGSTTDESAEWICAEVERQMEPV